MKSTDYRSGYQIRDQRAMHFITMTVCGWVDLFTRMEYRQILLESLQFCRREKGLILNAFVFMSNHIHLLARAEANDTLSDIVRDFKKFTHRAMMEIINSERESRRLWMLHQFEYYASRHSKNERYQIWTNGVHPEECYSDNFTKSKLSYIHENPVRAGWVSKPEDYLYSSAANYLGQKGVMEVDLLY